MLRVRALLTLVLLTLAWALPTAALAQAATTVAPPEFTSRAEAERFHALTEELRCVKCQNQSLADSNAAIAQDLRNEVLVLMRKDMTDAEIKQYLVARYGEFVLYRPRVEPTTWLLWFGPAVLLLAGGLVVVGIVRRRADPRAAAAPDEARDQEQEW
ncbi:MAG: cytochrome c-type biogenesis protein CcmH [Lysobacter sp.]|nr:cytochrome c-type biogenesis protein CcmH [Lysobacter sp.]MDV5980485.1 cytochrome c-type biogenesis protein CcmH [Lysobacter sp.]